ncbi:hypothetical protein [uncultured Polaribacter sp.]|uniref:hypothetical protein n=1 Tax=uncultured Polaribacter sp. TaxID=174711 RepID=UPI00261E374A|nr:hypothetical protein [uncultured Polaribacter sp.]
MSTYTTKAVKFSLSILLLIVIVMILSLFDKSPYFDVISTIIGILTFIIIIFGIMGLFYSIKGIKEKSVIKKIVALIVNTGTVILFTYIIIANINDLIKFLN